MKKENTVENNQQTTPLTDTNVVQQAAQTTPIEGQISMSGYCWRKGRWCHPFTLKPVSRRQFLKDEVEVYELSGINGTPKWSEKDHTIINEVLVVLLFILVIVLSLS